LRCTTVGFREHYGRRGDPEEGLLPRRGSVAAQQPRDGRGCLPGSRAPGDAPADRPGADRRHGILEGCHRCSVFGTHAVPAPARAGWRPIRAPHCLLPRLLLHLRGRREREPSPDRIFQGTADDLAPPAPCRAYVERLRRAGVDAQITEYAGASHQFDRPGPPRRNPSEQDASRCLSEERPEGQLVSRDSGQPFAWRTRAWFWAGASASTWRRIAKRYRA
jgi:acetyl esterase/lipase